MARKSARAEQTAPSSKTGASERPQAAAMSSSTISAERSAEFSEDMVVNSPVTRTSGQRPGLSCLARSSSIGEQRTGTQTSETGRPKKLYKPRKSPLVREEERQIKKQAQAAREEEKAGRAAEKRAREDSEKESKILEVIWLMEADRPAPLPYLLQLLSLPARQNIKGRNLPIKVLAHDATFPQTDAARNAFVTELLNSTRDVREAKDTISITTEFRYVWLKPALEQKLAYDEMDMERVCRKLVSIAEGLHTYGLGATEIYCPRTAQKAVNANALSFKTRIDMLAALMRRSKSRCDSFMLGNTMEVNVALTEDKLTAHKSNCENNKNRSVKLQYTNLLQGLKKGQAWPRDAEDNPVPPTFAQPASGYDTPKSMVVEGKEPPQDEGGSFAAPQTLESDNEAESVPQNPPFGSEGLQQDVYPTQSLSQISHLSQNQSFDDQLGASLMTEHLSFYDPPTTYTPLFEMHPENVRYLENLNANRQDNQIRDPYYAPDPSMGDWGHYTNYGYGMTGFTEVEVPCWRPELAFSTAPSQQAQFIDNHILSDERDTDRATKRRRRGESNEQVHERGVELFEGSPMDSVVRGRTAMPPASAAARLGERLFDDQTVMKLLR